MAVNLRSLIGKFNSATRSATEAAAGLCLARTHFDVELEHYLLKLVDSTDGDFPAITQHYQVIRLGLHPNYPARWTASKPEMAALLASVPIFWRC